MLSTNPTPFRRMLAQHEELLDRSRRSQRCLRMAYRSCAEEERLRITGVSRVQFWRLERDGKAPRRVPLGPNSVGWLRHELDEWIIARAALRRGLSQTVDRRSDESTVSR